VSPRKSEIISSTPGAIPFRGFAFSGIVPLWTRSNANPISSCTSSGNSRNTSRELPMNCTGLIAVAAMRVCRICRFRHTVNRNQMGRFKFVAARMYPIRRLRESCPDLVELQFPFGF
jgi:hypothetical protein